MLRVNNMIKFENQNVDLEIEDQSTEAPTALLATTVDDASNNFDDINEDDNQSMDDSNCSNLWERCGGPEGDGPICYKSGRDQPLVKLVVFVIVKFMDRIGLFVYKVKETCVYMKIST